MNIFLITVTTQTDPTPQPVLAFTDEDKAKLYTILMQSEEASYSVIKIELRND